MVSTTLGPYGGTDGSNLSSSDGESVANPISSEDRFGRLASYHPDGRWQAEPVTVAATADLSEHIETGLKLLHNSPPQRTDLADGQVGEFGLTPPRLAVTAHRSSGASITVEFGGTNPLGLERYARIVGRSEVLLIPAFVGTSRVAAMTIAWRIAVAACWLVIALLPTAAGAHITATGLAVVAVNDREIDYRLTVVPSELPEPAGQLLARAMARSRPDAEGLAEAMRRAVVIRVDGAPCRPVASPFGMSALASRRSPNTSCTVQPHPAGSKLGARLPAILFVQPDVLEA